MIARATVTLVLVAALAGCATPPVAVDVVAPRTGDFTALKARAVDRALEDRILALDPARVSARDVAEVLAKAPAPRMMLVHGGVYPVHLAMTSFGTFLVAMGYPEAKIRDPASGEWSYSPYTTTRRLAGIAAWQYEQDAMRPMIVGHSQGGLYVVKILKELAGTYQPTLPVWNPVVDQAEARTTIVDPLTGRPGPQIMPGAFSFSNAQAMESLGRIEVIEAGVLLVGHGDPWTAGVAAAVARAREAGPS